MGKRYTPSNKFSVPLSILFFLFGVLLCSTLSGIGAMFGLWLLPPFAGMVLSFVTAGCIYWILQFCMKWSKNRNVLSSRFIILLTSILSAFLHMATISSVKKVMGDNIHQISVHLDSLTFERIIVGTLAYFTAPTVPVKNMILSGGAWIVYLILIILFYLLIPQLAAEQAKEPFNEESNQWMTKVVSIGRLELIPDREQRIIVTALKVGDITPLLRRPRYSSQLSDDYSLVTFYKVAHEHTGYIGVDNMHQLYDSKKRPIENKFQTIEFIPPIQIGMENAEKLENSINIQPNSMEPLYEEMIPEPATTLDIGEEFGYRLYRTTNDAPLTFDSATLDRAKESETLKYYRRSPNRELSESFQMYAKKSKEEKISNKKQSRQVGPRYEDNFDE